MSLLIVNKYDYIWFCTNLFAARSERAVTLCEIESLLQSIGFHPRRKSKWKIVTFGVNYDGVFTMEALYFMTRLPKSNTMQLKGVATTW